MAPFATHTGGHRSRAVGLLVGLVVTALVVWLGTAGRQTVTHGLPAPATERSAQEATSSTTAPSASATLHDDFSDRLSG